MEVLQELAARLAIPGLPDWTGLLAVLALVLAGLAYLLMPFSVFGLKGRIEGLEVQLDEIQTELRGIAMRLPEPSRHIASDSYLEVPPRRGEPREFRAAPPVPPPPVRPEPRLDWPGPGRR